MFNALINLIYHIRRQTVSRVVFAVTAVLKKALWDSFTSSGCAQQLYCCDAVSNLQPLQSTTSSLSNTPTLQMIVGSKWTQPSLLSECTYFIGGEAACEITYNACIWTKFPAIKVKKAALLKIKTLRQNLIIINSLLVLHRPNNFTQHCHSLGPQQYNLQV